MGRKRGPNEPEERLSPVRTVSHLTDEFVEALGIPVLPDKIPDRLEEAVRRRVHAFLYYLREGQKRRFVGALEIRLIRDAQRAVLTAYELGLADREQLYAAFRRLVEGLGYERTEVGFRKREDAE